MLCYLFFFSSRRRHTRCALVTGVQTCALPISRALQRFTGLAPDDLYGFESDEADVRYIFQTGNERAQRILKIDALDHHGSITFEHMAAVAVRRRPKPDQPLKPRETRHLTNARKVRDLFENLVLDGISRFHSV